MKSPPYLSRGGRGGFSFLLESSQMIHWPETPLYVLRSHGQENWLR